MSCDNRFKCVIQEYDENENRTKSGDKGWQNGGSHTLTVGEKTNKINIYFAKQDPHSSEGITDEELSLLKNSIQMETSSSKTTYEPYKTNILTVNEEVELRGIGNVKDELDCLTGKVTERIGEVVLDGSENWQLDGHSLNISGINDNLCFYTKDINNTYLGGDYWDNAGGILSSKLSTYGYNYLTGVLENYQGIAIVDGRIAISIDKDLLSSNDSIGLKEWLQSNPLTVQYELAEPVIKTVVLNPSGTLASETPYMWKDGSIQLSSDGLAPCLDYAVTTSRVGVIENNMNETITNEKRIHALEVILAQSTIAAAADAVSLQSDLESTTMSTDGVQLETENTQDNFLYEMILLLIENNAHDKSLFDKVCMFYLYGKLSDEQFTNIYNLLYPVNPEEE